MITHQWVSSPSTSLQKKINQIKEKITTELQMLVDQLASCELGQFLLQHAGLNGYWTHYIIGYQAGQSANPFEDRFLTMTPSLCATRERFAIFQKRLQDVIQSNDTVCSLPCGMMSDLLTLQLRPGVENVRFVGIDFDDTVFSHAEDLAKQHAVKSSYTFLKRDAWSLEDQHESFNVLTSNGLNIYVKEEERVIDLYKEFYKALKPNGTLITSFLTYPCTFPELTEWDMTQVDKAALQFQAAVFGAILEAKWNHFRTSNQTRKHLAAAGFQQIEFWWDKARMFPTVTARKAG